MISGQEYNKGREAAFQTNIEAAKCYTVQPEPSRGSTEVAGATRG